ncbi:sugar ABC transporter ATP-binding protein [Rhodobacter sp. 24-YEA-8]|uniref:sugar ABC transporter ATP-binding protein n=1 Tax=Rhodobacter sp. 24-YEA-8 TaxID=1884310 RepID=UPI000898DF66|nr:sugar ABC transporter ATP-binding protein [Rhodobacter sp. 24-YEA-8]SED86333.1 monosaccharide ABC transporter ATP-binding protein, CUT2 family [Rhodobacter sp. 24-YEA-8]
MSDATGRESGSPAFAGAVALCAESLRKAYGATVALEHADISLAAGQVHALLGENGAGKSTLVRILTGAVRPDQGEMQIGAAAYAPGSILAAQSMGVATAFQELSLVRNLTVAQNLHLPHQPKGGFGINSRRLGEEKAAATLAKYDMGRISPRSLIADLPLAERQRIEILRAMEHASKVLILDEPTASLAETDWLFDLIRKSTARGLAVLYISHRLPEVRELATRATVLRNGRSIASVDLAAADDDDIFEMMVGHKVDHARPARAPRATATHRIEVKDVTGRGVNGAGFTLGTGEVLGVAALEGQGQRGLFRMLAGLEPVSSGEIRVDGKPVTLRSPRQALAAGSGIAFLPEERKTEGILAGLSTASNVVLPVLGRISRALIVGPKAEAKHALETASKVDLSPRYLGFAIGDLSGGNQQKALIARTMATGARTLVLYDPTRGVDVGTKQAIYDAIRAFADEGGSVLFYSSELPEIVQLADRALVFYGGRVNGIFEGEAITEQRLVASMLGQGAEHASRAKGEAA